jgi:hypothetical protein
MYICKYIFFFFIYNSRGGLSDLVVRTTYNAKIFCDIQIQTPFSTGSRPATPRRDTMTKMPSKANDLTRQILLFLYRNNVYAWRQNTGGVFDPSSGRFRTAPKKGVSDILGILPTGRLIAVEVKVGKDKLRPEQEGFLANIAHNNGVAIVAREFDSFCNDYNLMVK